MNIITFSQAKNQILEGKLENQELRAQLHSMSEGNILANLKQENRALWMRLNEVEANGQAENKKVMELFSKFPKFGRHLGL
jgi:regulator of replication initiation timing